MEHIYINNGSAQFLLCRIVSYEQCGKQRVCVEKVPFRGEVAGMISYTEYSVLLTSYQVRSTSTPYTSFSLQFQWTGFSSEFARIYWGFLLNPGFPFEAYRIKTFSYFFQSVCRAVMGVLKSSWRRCCTAQTRRRGA